MIHRILFFIVCSHPVMLVCSQPPDHIRRPILSNLMRSSRPYQNANYTERYYTEIVLLWRSGLVLSQMEAEAFNRKHHRSVYEKIVSKTENMTDIRHIQKTIEQELKQTVRPKL